MDIEERDGRFWLITADGTPCGPFETREEAEFWDGPNWSPAVIEKIKARAKTQ